MIASIALKVLRFKPEYFFFGTPAVEYIGMFSTSVVSTKPKAEVNNDKLRLVNSSYHVKTEFNNCFIIYLKERKKLPVVGHI